MLSNLLKMKGKANNVWKNSKFKPFAVIKLKGYITMQCTCGAEISEKKHKVETIRGLANWSENTPEIIQFPFTIEQEVCKCTRGRFKIIDSNGLLFDSRGY